MADESELIARAIAGSEDAFVALLERHQGRVRAYLGSYSRDAAVVDDLAQEVFLAAYRTLATYKGDAPLGIWLMGIARHRALEHLRSEARRHSHETGGLKGALARWRAEWAAADSRDLPGCDAEISALEACLEKLPERSRNLIVDYYFKARRAAVIARQLGCKQGAVRMTLLRIRQALRRCIQDRLLTGEA